MNSFRIDELGAAVRYIDISGGRPLVFLHGLGSASSFAFPGIAVHERLRPYRSILIDLLGFGYSDRPRGFSYSMDRQADVVARLLAYLEVEDAVLVGHSMGGAIAILVAAACPKRIGRLVLAEANLDPEPGIVSGIIARWAEEEYVVSQHANFVERMRAAGFGDYARTVEAAASVAMHRSAVDLIANRTPTFRDLLYSLPIPSMSLISEESHGDPDVERLPQRGIPVAIIPGSGHDMMTDNPAGLAEAIADAIG